MQNTNQKGFGALGILLVFLVIGVVGFGGWYILNNQKSPDTTTNTVSEQTETATTDASVLNQIKSDLLAYNPDSTEPANDIAADDTRAEYDGVTIVTTSDMYLNFKPQASIGTEEVITKMVEVLKKYNLEEASSSPYFSSRYIFEDDEVLCVITGNENFARLNCSQKERLNKLATNNSLILAAGSDSSDVTSESTAIHYEANAEQTQLIALLTANSGRSNLIFAKDIGGNWEIIAEVVSNQGFEPVDCSTFTTWQQQLVDKMSAISCKV